LTIAYRDLWLLIRNSNIPLAPSAYLYIQLALGALCAGLCLAMRWAGVDSTHQITTALMLGCCWITLCGPTTESSSFVQLAPALAWAMIAARLERWPLGLRWLPAAAFVCLMAGVLAGLTPWTGKIHGTGIQPWGTLLLFVAYIGATIHYCVAARPASTAGAGEFADRRAA
jgi:hypothetical protein